MAIGESRFLAVGAPPVAAGPVSARPSHLHVGCSPDLHMFLPRLFATSDCVGHSPVALGIQYVCGGRPLQTTASCGPETPELLHGGPPVSVRDDGGFHYEFVARFKWSGSFISG